MKDKRLKEKYAKELERIRELNALNKILKKGDVENAMLSNAAKESEPVSSNTVDRILNDLYKKGDERDIVELEKLTSGQAPAPVRRKGAAAMKTASRKRAKATKKRRRK